MTENNNVQSNSTPDYIRFFLKEPPLILKNFHHEDVMEFLKCGEKQHFLQDDVIVREGDYVNSAYLVAEGKVAIWQENIQLATLSTGTFLGETFLFSKNNRVAKVVSVEESTLLRFERHDILNFFRRKPEKLFNIFTRNIIEIQQAKISNMNVQLFNLKKRLLKDNGW
ncbi:MAG: cyclic nucleotide-binding domain-containing protein [Balneolaceae bacterium]|nr:cyclic nucleotide-binding domain-containing protein [Balneolaceae bacterium]